MPSPDTNSASSCCSEPFGVKAHSNASTASLWFQRRRSVGTDAPCAEEALNALGQRAVHLDANALLPILTGRPDRTADVSQDGNGEDMAYS
jgi:hypothetical protein